MPSGIEALAGRLDLSDAHELGDRLPIACDGDLLLALQHRLGSRPALAQVPHGDGLHGARLTCFTTLGPTGQIGATSLETRDRKSTRLNSSHSQISYAVFCLKKKKKQQRLCLKVAR